MITNIDKASQIHINLRRHVFGKDEMENGKMFMFIEAVQRRSLELIQSTSKREVCEDSKDLDKNQNQLSFD